MLIISIKSITTIYKKQQINARRGYLKFSTLIARYFNNAIQVSSSYAKSK
jgi:hypothetical protein